MQKKKTLKKVTARYGIGEYYLENGLRVLHKKVSAVPLITVCITFHVGSRNEAKGHTGATHILEHLLFKDSKNFNVKNGKSITNYLELFGAKMNATTWIDRTNYFEMLPKEHIGKALALEADRMRNSLFNDADLASEMTVVRNEYERSRNNPFEIIDEAMMATAFTVHPYRIPTIGFKEDIECSTATKLREFYDRFYWPNNATLSILGDVSEKEMKDLVIKYFGSIPSSPHKIPTMDVVEPIQTKPRSITITKPGDVSVAGLLYKTPKGTDKDYPALLLIANVLAGGFSSRLNKKLVDTSLAANAWFSLYPFHDPGTLIFFAHLTEEADPKKILSSLREVCLSFHKKPVTVHEIKRAKERILADLAEEHDGIFAETRALSESIAAGKWQLRYQLEERVKKLTVKDINRVYKKYIVSSNETSGLLLKR